VHHYALASPLSRPRTVTHLTLAQSLLPLLPQHLDDDDDDNDNTDTRHGTSTSDTAAFSPWRHR
jgi:hypothetical protein